MLNWSLLHRLLQDFARFLGFRIRIPVAPWSGAAAYCTTIRSRSAIKISVKSPKSEPTTYVPVLKKNSHLKSNEILVYLNCGCRERIKHLTSELCPNLRYLCRFKPGFAFGWKAGSALNKNKDTVVDEYRSPKIPLTNFQNITNFT